MQTVKSPREIDRVFRESTRVAHPLLIALIARTPEGRGLSGRVAVVAGKKLGGAVVRNRAKRVLRAAVALSGAQWSGHDVILIARPTTAAAGATDVAAAINTIVRRAGIRP